jgi:hypothetical protein
LGYLRLHLNQMPAANTRVGSEADGAA